MRLLMPVFVIAAQALREARRRRVLLVVLGLTALFGLLYAWGASELFDKVENGAGSGSRFLDARSFAGSTMLGLSMFGALFLGAVLGTFLTAGAVRGDAENGLLQPVLVRPIRRWQYMLGRFVASATVSALYVLVTYGAAVVVIGVLGDWWPVHPFAVALRLALAVVTLCALALLGSVVLGSTANGIFVLMLYGAGLVAGLMGTIGDAIRSDRLQTIADVGSWVLPFEGLYRDALLRLIGELGGVAGVLVQLGPLGGSHDGGPLLVPWALLYLVVVLAVATVLLRRRDL